MWFVPSRKKPDKSKASDATAAEASDEQLLVDQDGQVYGVTQEVGKKSYERQEQDTDSVEELFQGEYPPKIVDEVRTFEKPAWEEEVSSLDPVSDIDDFVQHGFNIPPAEYDEVQKIGKARLWKLEKLKAPLDSEDQAIVDARVDMVKHRSLEDVKWLKHKAYYRAMEKIRAEKAAEDKAHREEYLASKGAPLDVVPAAVIDAPSPMQQAAQAQAAAGRSAAAAGAAEAVPEDISRFYKPVGANVAELIDLQRAAQPSETTEWEEGWDTMSYLHRTDARRQLFNAFNLACDPDAGWAGEDSGPAEPAFDSSEEQELMQQLALSATQQHKQQFLAQSLSGTPETKYTPEFLAIRRTQKQVQRQGSQQRQAFYVSLAGALGALLVRQLLKKLRKPGSKPGSTAGVSA